MTIHEGKQDEKPQIEEKLEQYFIDISSSCPYGLPEQAVYHQALFGPVDPATMGLFLANGYRRNGNCMYAMRCPDCSGCLPIRINPPDFIANRNQKRVWKKNRDVSIGVAPLTMSDENLNLLDKFLQNRFPEGKSSAESYYSGFFITSITRCFEIRYRIDEQLLGVAVVDGSDTWLNAVYFFFDPKFADRSPGTLNILNLINFCQSHTIGQLYLGYLIESVKAMKYKSAFKPHELLLNNHWKKVERN
jgi:arginine-tRNA-protein transferase